MKKFISLFLLMSILLVMIVSCNKVNIDNGELNDTNTTIGTTTVVSTTEVGGHDDMCILTPTPSVDDYDENNLLSFIGRWKEQQRLGEEVRYNWLAIDGSPEKYLLVPEVLSEEYVLTTVRASHLDYHQWHKQYTEYFYSFVCEKEDFYNGITVSVIKGNRNYDMFYKDELTFEDLEFFVKEFVTCENCTCKTCKFETDRRIIRAYTDNAICLEGPTWKEWFILYNNQIIRIKSMDKNLFDSPEKALEYIAFKEITAE